MVGPYGFPDIKHAAVVVLLRLRRTAALLRDTHHLLQKNIL